MRTLVSIAVGSALFATAGGAVATPPDHASPTCSDVEFLGIDVHGQHVVRDYVAGGDAASDWPPSGQELGSAVRENGGAAVPGGPGPGFHFPLDIAPGASFCTDSRSGGR